MGIFLTPAGMAKSLGSPFWMLAVWLTMGASAIGGALCFGALAARYPEAGGIYVYLREVYGRRTAFLYGWLSLLVTDPGLTAMLAVGLARYAGHLVPLSPWGLKIVAIGAITILAVVNILGVWLGSRVLGGLAGLKLGLLGFFVIWGFSLGRGDWANLTPFWSQRPGSEPLVPALAGALDRGLHFSRGLVGCQQDRGRSARPAPQLTARHGAGRVDRHCGLHRRERGFPLSSIARPDRVG